MTMREVLTERSWRWLFEFVDFTLQPMLSRATSDAERERAIELHVVAFRELEALLKHTVDRRDQVSLTEIDREWSDVVEDPWWLWGTSPGPRDDPSLSRIARERVVARMGIAMWTAHEAGREDDPANRDLLLAMLQHVGAHFETLDQLFLAFDWAQSDGRTHQWDLWFLEQLPERRAHFIPTTQTMLLATLLLGLDRVNEESSVHPRAWMREMWDQIDTELQRLSADQDKWIGALGLQLSVASKPALSESFRPRSLSEQVGLLRAVLESGRDAATEAAKEEIRAALPDEAKRSDLRQRILHGFATQRLIGPLMQEAGAVVMRERQPEGYVRQVLKSWLPKELFVSEGRMVGIDLVAGDLVRVSMRAEASEMLKALPDTEGQRVGGNLGGVVRQSIEGMRAGGGQPSLVLVPTALTWAARQELRLDALDQALVTRLGEGRARALDGTIERVPVLDMPSLNDRVWIVDLRRAVRWEVWPSDEESGLALSIELFDRAGAERLLAEHPEIREQTQSGDDVVSDVRTKALLELAQCFRALPGDGAGAIALQLPTESLSSTRDPDPAAT